MHFNFKPWEFFSKHPQFLNNNTLGLYAFYCTDSYFSRLAHLKLKASLKQKMTIVTGSELTPSWIEDNFINLGLFGNPGPVIVLLAENTPVAAQDMFLEHQIDLSDRFILFSFSSKSSFYEKLKKGKDGTFYKIDSFPSWQFDRVVNFFCEELKLPLSYEVKSAILDTLPPHTAEIVNLLKNIKINFPNGINSLEELQPLLPSSHFDQFSLADILSEKKLRDFYKKLSVIDSSQGDWIKLFSFIQNHLLKISDTSYLKAKKGQPSQYDKKIIAASKRWNGDEIKREMKRISKFLILAKAKPNELRTELTLAYTRTFTI